MSKHIITRIMSSFETNQIGMIRDSKRLEAGEFCVIDVATILGRKQPVICSLTPVKNQNFRVLSLQTPLGTSASLEELQQHYNRYSFAYENDFLTVRLCRNMQAPLDDLYSIYMRIDLPVLSDDTKGKNSLSAYELNESLRLLVECADMTERLVFSRQDIDVESINVESQQLVKTNTTLHRTVSAAQLSGKWQPSWNRKYILLSHLEPKATPDKTTLWTLNHQTPFIKFLSTNGKTEATLNYLANDVQDKELHILEKYFNEVVTG